MLIEEQFLVQPSKKLPDYGTSVFAKIAQLASNHKALNLAQGFPNFNGSEKLLKLAGDYLLKGYNQYAPMPGDISLRERISEKTASLYGGNYHPDTEVTITTGALQALYAAITSIVERGDEVIILEPAFDSYRPIVELNNGIVKTVKLRPPNFEINWQRIKTQITPKTRAIILNSPNNPTGKIFTADDIAKLTELVRDTNIVIISDEVYEHMVFDGKPHISLASVPELRDRTIVISSFGKTLHVTGWRVGYCLAPAYLMKDIRKIHQFMVFSSASHAVQKAIADYIGDNSNYIADVNQLYTEKRDKFISLIKTSRFKLLPVEATFFLLMDYSAITDMADTLLAEELIKTHKLATIPCSAFYKDETDHKLLRICFAKSDDVLEQAASVLAGL